MYKTYVSVMASSMLLQSLNLLSSRIGFCSDHISALVLFGMSAWRGWRRKAGKYSYIQVWSNVRQPAMVLQPAVDAIPNWRYKYASVTAPQAISS